MIEMFTQKKRTLFGKIMNKFSKRFNGKIKYVQQNKYSSPFSLYEYIKYGTNREK